MNFSTRKFLNVLNSSICTSGRGFSFKSPYSLEKLYPESSLKLFTPKFVSEDSGSKFSGYIPIKELDITYSTSSGPGGQNVNRVNTKVDLRFHLKNASWLSEEIKEKLVEQNKTRISKEGYLVVKSELTRSQQLNLADALEKLRGFIRKAAAPGPAPPSQETLEMIRKREIKASRQRLFVKRNDSLTKQHRRLNANDVM